MSSNCLMKYVFVLLLCVLISRDTIGHKRVIAPVTTLHRTYNLKANLILINIPKDDDYNYTVYNEDYLNLRVVVKSPEQNYGDVGKLGYYIGDKLRLLCSYPRNKRAHDLHWHIRNGPYHETAAILKQKHNDEIVYRTHENFYYLYFEMYLRTFDNGSSVYCSATNSSGETVQRTSEIKLELLVQKDVKENNNTVYNYTTSSDTFDCETGDKLIKNNISNGMVLYCLGYTKSCWSTGGLPKCTMARITYNETILYYLNEKGTIGTITGFSVTIVLIIIAIVAFSLYRRRLRRNSEGTVTYAEEMKPETPQSTSPAPGTRAQLPLPGESSVVTSLDAPHSESGNRQEPVYEEIIEKDSSVRRPPCSQGLTHVRGIRLNPVTGILTVDETSFKGVIIKKGNQL